MLLCSKTSNKEKPLAQVKKKQRDKLEDALRISSSSSSSSSEMVQESGVKRSAPTETNVAPPPKKARVIKSSLTLDERLSAIKMPKDSYLTHYHSLIALGYTQEQADRLIIRPSSKNNVIALVKEHNDLIALLTPDSMSHSELIRVAARDGGGNNLSALKELYANLKAKGLSSEQIVRMASNNGGSQNLKAVTENMAALQELGCSSVNVVRFVSFNGGAKNLINMIAQLKQLAEQGLDLKELLKEKEKSRQDSSAVSDPIDGALPEEPLPVSHALCSDERYNNSRFFAFAREAGEAGEPVEPENWLLFLN